MSLCFPAFAQELTPMLLTFQFDLVGPGLPPRRRPSGRRIGISYNSGPSGSSDAKPKLCPTKTQAQTKRHWEFTLLVEAK
jgi:hypothetical protein